MTQTFNVTASFGLALFSPEETLDELYERADRALYDAKSSGRNISVWAKNNLNK